MFVCLLLTLIIGKHLLTQKYMLKYRQFWRDVTISWHFEWSRANFFLWIFPFYMFIDICNLVIRLVWYMAWLWSVNWIGMGFFLKPVYRWQRSKTLRVLFSFRCIYVHPTEFVVKITNWLERNLFIYTAIEREKKMGLKELNSEMNE